MNLFDLTGRVAVITGGNGGIGLGMAHGLTAAGAAVVIAGRNPEKNEIALKELKAQGAQAASVEVDITDKASCQRMINTAVEQFGRLDILINNAGTNIRRPAEEYELAEWNTVIETNLTAAFLCAQAAHAPMLKAGGGKIINIASMMSIFGASFAIPYASSKAGIVGLTRALATGWAKDNIQINAVLPGWVDTELTQRARREVDGLHDRVLARTPAGRWGVAADLSGIAIFLASRASDFITGTSIPVDGGYSVQG